MEVERNVTVQYGGWVLGSEKLRVAAYIRVSTGLEVQEKSYELQRAYFEKLIRSREDYELAGVYADYGVSGTEKGKRMEFKRLLRHCREGKIDRILCKSISRFARNTADLLEVLHTLNHYKVTIQFEKEGIDSSKPSNEFLLVLLGAIAQEESRSLSENVRWGYQKRFQKGIMWNLELYGYRVCRERKPVVQEGISIYPLEIRGEEAKVVRNIFFWFSKGWKVQEIARELNRRGVPAEKRVKESCQAPRRMGERSPGVDIGWTGQRVREILRNERYGGELLLQKTWVADYLTHRSIKNRGERPKYWVHDHHIPIVPPDIYLGVEKRLKEEERSGRGGNGNQRYPLSGLLVCGNCGRYLGTENRRHYPKWYCPTAKLKNGMVACSAESIYEEQVVKALKKGMRKYFSKGFEKEGEVLERMYQWLWGLHTWDQKSFGREDRWRGASTGEEKVSFDREEYRTRWEESYCTREETLAWLEQGLEKEFWNEVAGKFARAFVYAVVVFSPVQYEIYWFNTVRTRVNLRKNIQNFRMTEQYARRLRERRG